MAYYCNRCGRRLRSAEDKCKYCSPEIPLSVDYEPDDIATTPGPSARELAEAIPAKPAADPAPAAADAASAVSAPVDGGVSAAPVVAERQKTEMQQRIEQAQQATQQKRKYAGMGEFFGHDITTEGFDVAERGQFIHPAKTTSEFDLRELAAAQPEAQATAELAPAEPQLESQPLQQPELDNGFDAAGLDEVFEGQPGDESEGAPPPENEDSGAVIKRGGRGKRGANNRLFMILGVVAAVLVVATVFVFLLGGFGNSTSREYLAYLEGDWLSEDFMYNSDNSKRLVEYLQVDAKGNFTMRYFIPDDQKPNGYRDGGWQLEYEVSGTIQIDVIDDTKVMRLVHEQDGKTYYYERFFVTKDESTMCLREYYNDGNTFDMVFNRVS